MQVESVCALCGGAGGACGAGKEGLWVWSGVGWLVLSLNALSPVIEAVKKSVCACNYPLVLHETFKRLHIYIFLQNGISNLFLLLNLIILSPSVQFVVVVNYC